MRQDQFEKLQELTEKLTDAFIGEADPDKWPGHGVELASMDQQTRGDRYWSKKNAAATLSVIMRTTTLIGVIQRNSVEGTGAGVSEQDQEEDGLDAEVRSAEKEATRLLAKIQKRSGKVHGKG